MIDIDDFSGLNFDIMTCDGGTYMSSADGKQWVKVKIPLTDATTKAEMLAWRESQTEFEVLQGCVDIDMPYLRSLENKAAIRKHYMEKYPELFAPKPKEG